MPLNPYYQEKGITIYCGDCLEIMPELEPSVDMIFTSPPYYNAKEYSTYRCYEDYLDFIRSVFDVCITKLKPGRPFIFNVSCVIEPRQSRSYESRRLPIPFDCVHLAQAAGFKFLEDIIWKKPDGSSSRAVKFAHHRRPVAYKPFQVTEYVFVFREPTTILIDEIIREHSQETIEQSLVKGDYERTNVWEICPTSSPIHSAVFPMQLARNLIEYYSFVYDTILDPLMGSGTTLVAAKYLGRRAIGIEISQEYCDMAIKRIAQYPLEI